MALLGDLVEFYNGKSVKAETEGAYVVYGANGVIGKWDKYLYEKAIIIGRVGAYCGAVSYCESKFWASDNTIVAKNKPNTDLKFLYYLLKDLKLNRYAGVAAQPLVTQSILKKLEGDFESNINTQRKIVEVLSAYDDLIENNNRRIQILEEMAQRLYKEWFVDFRFPNHENTRLIDSELGKIPQGWEAKIYADLFDIKYGKNLPTSKLLKDAEYPVYGASKIIGYYNKSVCDDKVVLVSCRGAGSGAIYRTRGKAFITNNSLILTPKKAHEDYLHYPFVQNFAKISTNMGGGGFWLCSTSNHN